MSEPAHFLEAIREHAVRDNPAELKLGRDAPTLSYRALWSLVVQKSEALRADGFTCGQRAAISMSNTLDCVISTLGVLHAGGTVLPLYYRPDLRAVGKDFERIVSILRASRAPYLLTHRSEFECHERAAAEAATSTRVLALETSHQPSGLDPAADRCQMPEGRAAIIQFSAGSTAEPKGLCLRHEQLSANARGFCLGIDWTAQDRVYSWLPLFHDMGLVAAVLTSLRVGAGLTLGTPQAFIMDPIGWLRQMSTQRSTISMAPQFAYDLVLAKARLSAAPCAGFDLSALRTSINGAEIVDAAACDAFERFFAAYGLRKHVIQPGYGLAENCVAVAVRPPGTPRLVRNFDRAELRNGRVALREASSDETVSRAGNGFAVAGTRFVVLDEDGRTLGENEVGEVAISGDASARASLRSDGELIGLPDPLRTGDLGVVHAGELFIVGRVKEMVKRGGEAFSPTDVEHCVRSHIPELLLNAAFGYHDSQTGTEEVVVVAESRDWRRSDRVAELSARIRVAVLSVFRLPLQEVVIVRPRTITRTTSGKIRRIALRDDYLAGALSSTRVPHAGSGG
ncbi:MAG: hypothetical protein RLZZ450_156 [Pseudomonadota bacterium]|jgi:acyl-CoA synthetase (AMP-forming)/AMP-acid ligase II